MPVTYEKYRRCRRSFTAVYMVNAAFVILTVLAMVFYPGGTQDDESVVGYSMWENFFSDAGRTEALIGEPNTVSFILSTLALCMVGVVTVFWFLAMPALFTASKTAGLLSRPAAVLGVISGLSFVAVSFTPSNLNMDLHMNFVYSAFICFTAAFVLLTAAMFLEDGYPKIYPAVLIVFLLMLLTYIYLVAARPVFGGFSSLAIQATSQKIIVYTMIACTIFQAHGALKVLSRKFAAQSHYDENRTREAGGTVRP